MEACVNAYEMRMPAHYVDMNKEEMEYDGGWWVVSLGLIAAGLVCTAIGHYTGNKTVQGVGTVLGVMGIVSTGFGAVTMASAASVSTVEAGVWALGASCDGLTWAGIAYDAAKR